MKRPNLLLGTVFMILILSVVPLSAFGTGVKYFEFAPDTGLTLNIASVDTPYQIFYPQNDFVSGFDVWIDNVGSPGTASFGLRDANDNLLTAKTVSIPYVPQVWGGQTLHIEFDNPVAVSSTALYKIKMATSMSNLRLYYANRIQLLQHTAGYVPIESVLGPARLGTVDQNFFFKIALYENGDTIPPIISNVTSSFVSTQSLQLEFNTNEPVDYQVVLAPAGGGDSQIRDWSGIYEFCNPGILNCGASFSVLPNTAYNYQIAAKDYAGNLSQTNGVLTTPDNPLLGSTPSSSTSPTESPAIISDARIVSLYPRSVKISWQTDKAANSNLVLSLDPLGNQIVGSVTDTTLELTHTLDSGAILTPETNYFAAIASTAPDSSPASQILGFTTPKETAPPPDGESSTNPSEQSQSQTNNSQSNNQGASNTNQTNGANTSPSNQGVTANNSNLPEPTITILPSDQNGGNKVIIEWSAPQSGEPNNGYRIDIFDSNNKLTKQIIVPSGVHKVEIEDLPPGVYRFLIYANQNGILERIVKEATVTIHEKTISFFKSSFFYWLVFLVVFLGAIIGFYAIRFKRTNSN